MKSIISICVGTLLVMSLSVPAMAQAGGGYGGGGGYGQRGRGGGGNYGQYGGRGNRGGGQQQFNPAQMMNNFQQRQLDRIKTQLGTTDDEFAAIQPMIQTLLQNQMANRFRRVAGNRGQALATYNFGQAPTPLQQATSDLEEAVNDPDSTPDIIEAKLAAVRAARERQQEEIAVVQHQLRQVLTERQEAVLTLSGLLG